MTKVVCMCTCAHMPITSDRSWSFKSGSKPSSVCSFLGGRHQDGGSDSRHILEAGLGVHTHKRKKGSKTKQRETQKVIYLCLCSPGCLTWSSEAGVAPQNCPKLRQGGPAFVLFIDQPMGVGWPRKVA